MMTKTQNCGTCGNSTGGNEHDFFACVAKIGEDFDQTLKTAQMNQSCSVSQRRGTDFDNDTIGMISLLNDHGKCPFAWANEKQKMYEPNENFSQKGFSYRMKCSIII